MKLFQDYFQNNVGHSCDLFAAMNYKLLKTIFFRGSKRVETSNTCNLAIMDFQTIIFWDFAYLISPYQISKNERKQNFKLSPSAPLLQKLALKCLSLIFNIPIYQLSVHLWYSSSALLLTWFQMLSATVLDNAHLIHMHWRLYHYTGY